jgi:hypothetical protein
MPVQNDEPIANPRKIAVDGDPAQNDQAIPLKMVRGAHVI